MQETMGALYAQSPRRFEWTRRPMPVPGPREIVVRVACCAICHTDLMIFEGLAGHAKYPFIPGHEFAGTVVALGADAHRYALGTRGVARQIIPCGVCRPCQTGGPVVKCLAMREMGCDLDGGMAEYCVLPEDNLIAIPDDLSFAEAALTEPLANACCAIRESAIQPNDRVVVIGPGPIGIFAARVAKLCGAGQVILLGTREARLRFARAHDYGVDMTVNVREPDALAYLRQTTLDGAGADVVVEASGTIAGLETALSLAARGARIVAEGLMPRDARMPFNTFSLPDCASLHRISAWSRLDFLNALTYIAEKRVDAASMITHRAPMHQWQAAFETASDKKDETMKIILTNDTGA